MLHVLRHDCASLLFECRDEKRGGRMRTAQPASGQERCGTVTRRPSGRKPGLAAPRSRPLIRDSTPERLEPLLAIARSLAYSASKASFGSSFDSAGVSAAAVAGERHGAIGTCFPGAPTGLACQMAGCFRILGTIRGTLVLTG